MLWEELQEHQLKIEGQFMSKDDMKKEGLSACLGACACGHAMHNGRRQRIAAIVQYCKMDSKRFMRPGSRDET